MPPPSRTLFEYSEWMMMSINRDTSAWKENFWAPFRGSGTLVAPPVSLHPDKGAVGVQLTKPSAGFTGLGVGSSLASAAKAKHCLLTHSRVCMFRKAILLKSTSL